MKTLFDPVQAGDLQLANRIVMAPLTRNRSPNAVPQDMTATYYSQRATAGLLISEATAISQQGQGYADVPGLYAPEQLLAWKRVTDAVHANGGKIVTQLCESLPSGPIMAKVPRIIKVPEGEAYVATENPLGEMGYYVVSKGDLGPFRVRVRTASFNNISIVPWLLRGVYVPDIITILGSLYFILGDIDK